MRALFGVVVSVGFLAACQTSSDVGEGALELSPPLVAGYEQFKRLDRPGYFAVPPDGSTYGYSYCRDFNCRGNNPSIAMNHFHYAWLLLVLDRYDEAVVEHELAQELDPFTPMQSALLGFWRHAC